MEKSCEVNPRPRNFKELIRSAWFWNPVRYAVIGGILGYLYYHFIGCNSGSCAITSDPYRSIAAGIFLGFFYAVRPCRTC